MNARNPQISLLGGAAGGGCLAGAMSLNPACLGGKVFKDPHLSFAYGGTADFRGRHNTLYNFLSTPRLSVNVRTEEALFQLHDGALMVNGTFLVEAHLVAKLEAGFTAKVSFWASELGPQNWGWQVA